MPEGSGEGSEGVVKDTVSTSETELINWFKEHAVPLNSTEPQEDQADLASMKDVIGDSQVVGLGEATHGNKEFFQLKHRLIKYLVEEMDFDTVAMECPEDRARIVDEYLQGKDVDQNDLLHGVTYEVWRTQEVIDLLKWLKEFNAKSDRKVRFIGCDVDSQEGMNGLERDQKMAEKVEGVLAAHPESKVALWAHNYHVGYTEGQSMGSHLKSKIGDKYMNVGLFGNQGSLSVRTGDLEEGPATFGPPTEVPLKPAQDDTYEHLFSQTGIPIGFVDLRAVRGEGILGEYGFREIGWAYDPNNDDFLTRKSDISATYDTAIFVDTVSPTAMFRSW